MIKKYCPGFFREKYDHFSLAVLKKFSSRTLKSAKNEFKILRANLAKIIIQVCTNTLIFPKLFVGSSSNFRKIFLDICTFKTYKKQKN